MQYMRSIEYIRDRKNWMSNILMGALCSLIPVVGKIVYTGWMFEVIDSLHQDPEHREYSDFDFNRFSQYLGRGIWPFLGELVVSMIVVMPFSILYVVLFMGGMFAAKSAGTPIFMVLGWGAGFLVLMIGVVLGTVVSWPVLLHTGISGEFNFSGMLAFTKDFLRRVGKETAIAVLFFIGLGVVFSMLGMLACFVGLYLAVAVITMMEHHLLFQLYELYLERGGEPIQKAGSVRVNRPEADNLPG